MQVYSESRIDRTWWQQEMTQQMFIQKGQTGAQTQTGGKRSSDETLPGVQDEFLSSPPGL